MCREEALELSSLKPKLDALGVQLLAVVHQRHGIDEFRPFFKGSIYLDKTRKFYGPQERWMFLSGFVRPSVWLAGYRAYKKGVSGNLEGEGRLLGGLFVIGAGEQGILFEHRESEFGDHANLTAVMEAAQKISNKKDN